MDETFNDSIAWENRREELKSTYMYIGELVLSPLVDGRLESGVPQTELTEVRDSLVSQLDKANENKRNYVLEARYLHNEESGQVAIVMYVKDMRNE